MNITDEIERLTKLQKEGALSVKEFEQAKSKLLTQAQTSPNADYEILPNGRKRFLKATGVDIIISIFLPGWGLIVGTLAYFAKGEKKRGSTMMTIGGIVLFLVIISGNFK